MKTKEELVEYLVKNLGLTYDFEQNPSIVTDKSFASTLAPFELALAAVDLVEHIGRPDIRAHFSLLPDEPSIDDVAELVYKYQI